MADGRNAHLIQEDSDWWLRRIKQRFKVLNAFPMGKKELVVLASSKIL
jgi:hypothetical protein